MEIGRNKFLLIGLLVMGSLLSGYMLYKSLREAFIRSDRRAEEVFGQAVALDKGIREREISAYRRIYLADESDESALKEPPMITIRAVDTLIAFENTSEFKNKLREEKDYIIDQIYLLYKNPIRVTRLDSLYQTLLSEANIPAEHAVVYETKEGKSSSRPDSIFYRVAHPLKACVIGINREIVLQPYVRYSFLYLLRQVWPACLVCLIVWLGCIGYGVMLHREKKRASFAVVPLSKASPRLLGIADHLFFDEANGILIYKEKQIELVQYRLRLFVCLLAHTGEYLSSDQLREAVWEGRLAGKDALAQTVKRLRDDLASVPVLSIENVRGKGYILKIKERAASGGNPGVS